MPTDTTVKFLHSAMTGAPTLSGTAGTMIAVLDACLVNGFGTGTVDSIVIAGGIATVTKSAGHPFEVGSVALIAGATVTGGSINGEQKVLSVPNVNTYTFDATGISNQTATGTITHKVAPINWAKTFSNTNLAAYKSSNVAATGCLLRVDDTGTTNARVVGYETMSDVNTGTGPFPTAAQVSGGAFWGKSNAADATTRAWIICGDDRGFYISVAYTGGNSGYSTVTFGDFLSNKSPDAYCCSVSGGATSPLSTNAGAATSDICVANATVANGHWLPRGVSGLGSAQALYRSAYTPWGAFNANTASGASGHFASYPNPADNALYVTQYTLAENNSFRGTLPGAYYVPQNVGAGVFASKDSVTSAAGLLGRVLKAIVQQAGLIFVDTTGPWR